MLLQLALISIFVLVISFILNRLHISLIAGYIISGIIIGVLLKNGVFGTKELSTFSGMADIGVVFLMFMIGAEFPIKKIVGVKSKTFILAILQIVLTSIALILIFIISGYAIKTAVVFGILFSFSSTVIVAKFLAEKGLVHTDEGETSLTILIIQDLIVIPISIFLSIILKIDTVNLTVILNLLLLLLKSALIIGCVFAITSKIMPYILKKISASFQQDLLLLSIISLSLFMSGFLQNLGFPLSLGAFLAGMTVSLTTEKYAIFSEIKPLRDIFSIVFFVFLGFSIDFGYVLTNFGKVAFFAIIVILLKSLIVFLLTLKFNIYPKNGLKISINLAEVSEFAFILSSLYFSEKILGQDDYKFIVALTLITIIVSPFLFDQEKKIISKFKSFFDKHEKNKYIFAGNLSLDNHIVICGYGRIGKRVVKSLVANGIPCIIIDNNKKNVESLQSFGLTAVYGDASDIEILNFANLKKAKAIVIALPDRLSQETIIASSIRLNPRIIIYARAHENSDKQYLYALGASFVLYPEHEGALALSERLLKIYKN